MIGSRLAHYLITKKLGEGGMGVVYQARDERLEREVALKILPPDLLSDRKARSRLLREAQLASTLNHPNICTIHGLEEAGGQDFIVMEFVKGRELRAITPAGGLPAAQVARYGAQIAGALAHAHGHGVVHRDLKSSNVMITADDRVKVLDFGLAKRQEEEENRQVTRSNLSLTGREDVLGTPYAMAPEVLKGNPPDIRSDIWGLGIVLYEMAAGAQPFAGRTGIEVSAAILREPPLPLPQSLSAGIRGVILRCLEKEPGRRYQSAGEVQAALEAAQSTTAIAIRPQRFSKGKIAYIAAAVLAIAVGVTSFLVPRSRRQPPAVRYEQLTSFSDSVTSPALSPDGRMLAFIHGEGTFNGRGEIWAKLLPDGEPVQLTNDSSNKMGPAFSPDGSRIAYTHADQWPWDTWTVPALGGAAGRWLPNSSGLTWIGKNQILFSEITSGLYVKIVTSEENRGGERDVYLPPNAEISMAHHSHLSPDGKWVLVTEMDSRGWLPCRVVPFRGETHADVVGPAPSKCTSAAWSPDGKWMYFTADAGGGFHLWRQEFPDGKPEQITFGATEEEGIAVEPDGKSLITAMGVAQSSIYLQEPSGLRQLTLQGYAYMPSISPEGKQVYYLLRTGSSRAFVAGDLRAVELVTGHNEKVLPGFSVARYDISADGKQVVFAALDAGGESSVWLASLTRSFPPRRLTQKEGFRPFFGPSGYIFYLSRQEDKDYVYRVKEDGTSQERVIADPVIYLLAVSPDGQQLVTWVERKEGDTPSAVVVYPLSGGKPSVLCTRCAATGPAYVGASIVNWSPDGKFFYLRMELPGMYTRSTYVIPLATGHTLPNLPANGFTSAEELKAIRGVREIPHKDVFPGRDPLTYAISATTAQRNLYRVRLP
jgi:serine/threonine protein kinase